MNANKGLITNHFRKLGVKVKKNFITDLSLKQEKENI